MVMVYLTLTCTVLRSFICTFSGIRPIMVVRTGVIMESCFLVLYLFVQR